MVVAGAGINAISELIFATLPITVLEGKTSLAFFWSTKGCSARWDEFFLKHTINLSFGLAFLRREAKVGFAISGFAFLNAKLAKVFRFLLGGAASSVLSIFWLFSCSLSFSFLRWFELGFFARGSFGRAHSRIAVTIWFMCCFSICSDASASIASSTAFSIRPYIVTSFRFFSRMFLRFMHGYWHSFGAWGLFWKCRFTSGKSWFCGLSVWGWRLGHRVFVLVCCGAQP